MTEEKIYLFDLNGFIVLKAVVKSKWIVAANGLIQERFHAPLGRLPRQVPTAAPGSGHGEKNIRASSGEMSAVNFRRR
jgi:hypothetical protein